MSFETVELGRESGQPINLYRFVKGDEATGTICYTDAEAPILYQAVDKIERYAPIPIQRDSVKADGSLDKTTMNIKLARDTAISELFRVALPPYVVSLFMYQGHFGEVDFRLQWSGKVLQRTVSGMVATMVCEPIASSMRRPALRRNWQRGCPLALYSEGLGQCNARKVGKTVKIEEVQSSTLVLVSHVAGMPFQDDQYSIGTFEFDAAGHRDVRNILSFQRQSSTSVIMKMSGLTRDMPVGTELTIYPGCRHTTDNCDKVFNNMVNYGGQPYIPLENPTGKLTTYV